MSTPTSTQQAHPVRASRRTAAQTVLSVILVLGIVAPLVAAILADELGEHLPEAWLAWIAGAAALIAAVSAALARIMAIPAVDAWLRHLGLSSRPPVAATGAPGKGDHVTTLSGHAGTILYADLRDDGWHYGVQLDGSDQVRMYRQRDLA